MLEIHNIDCMEYMAALEDDAFELAIVDPPYGIAKASMTPSRIKKYGQLNTVNDLKPNECYFNELSRVSKNQIIWGYNHLSDMLPSCREFIFWYKHQPVSTYSDGELAWTSFQKTAKCFDHSFYGAINADIKRIHPTQKPIKLYKWLLKNYANEGDRILDTHLGSGSSAIAAHYGDFDFVGCELDTDYFNAAKNRIECETAQKAMF